jgi:hypothetical protein
MRVGFHTAHDLSLKATDRGCPVSPHRFEPHEYNGIPMIIASNLNILLLMICNESVAWVGWKSMNFLENSGEKSNP